MNKSALVAILIASVVAIPSVVVGIISGWIPQPARVRTWHVVTALLFLVAISAIAVELTSQSSESSDTPETQAAIDSEVSAQDLAPDLVDQLVLTNDDSSGSPILFSSHLDGTNRQRVWSIGSDLTPTFAPNSTDLVVSQSVGTTSRIRIEMRTITGDPVRVLTHPGENQQDQSPTVDAAANVVYFIRLTYTAPVDGTSTVKDSAVMSVPLDGKSKESFVQVPIALSSVSVSANGSVIAGQCNNADPQGGPVQACITEPGSGTFRRIPGSENSSVSDIAVSPDGKWVAYSSVTTNPYGKEQVYVYNVTTKKVTMLSQLPGFNNQPAWPEKSKNSCLAFHHNENDEDSIYVGCLNPKPAAAKAISVGEYPVWFRAS